MAENMDVGLIEKEFEKGVTTNTMRNVLTGDIVRMCLIEMQFLKKEVSYECSEERSDEDLSLLLLKLVRSEVTRLRTLRSSH